jgi:hypothetical protein
MSFSRIALAFVTVTVLGCAANTADESDIAKSSAALERASCGGIAGLICPEGQQCVMHETYPDAMGFCAGPGEARAEHDRCALIRCLAVECPAGQIRKYSAGNCCGVCVNDPKSTPLPEGSCNSPADCDGLIHIMCVGSWACVSGSCSYSCDVGDPISL